MELITTELLERFKTIGNQSETSNPIIVAKFFNPCGAGTWYISEYHPEDQTVFCYVTGLGYNEWGYTPLVELQDLKLPFGLGIERDTSFKETRFKNLNLN